MGRGIRPKIKREAKDENKKQVEDMQDYFKIEDSVHLHKYLKANRVYDSGQD